MNLCGPEMKLPAVVNLMQHYLIADLFKPF